MSRDEIENTTEIKLTIYGSKMFLRHIEIFNLDGPSKMGHNFQFFFIGLFRTLKTFALNLRHFYDTKQVEKLDLAFALF